MGALVSIIICTLNHAEYLRATLQSITRVDIPAGIEVEVIVVDNGSQDQTSEVVRSFAVSPVNIQYFSEPRRGQSYARNTGMAEARGEIFLWTDDDVTLPVSWISDMVTPLLSGEYQGTGGRVKMHPSLERPWMTRSHYIRLSDTRCWADDFAVMIGANMAFTRDVLKKIPAFDVELGPGQAGFRDDTLFYSQMLVAGFKIAAIPHSIVEHNFEPSRLTTKYWIKNAISSGNSTAYMNHHWQHDPVEKPVMKEMFWKTMLAAFRATQGRRDPDAEGCHRFEMKAVENVTFYQMIRKISSETRHYDRLGLVKKNGKT